MECREAASSSSFFWFARLNCAPLFSQKIPKKFFHIESHGGVSWLVDPEGREFFSTGIDVLTPTDAEETDGRSYSGLRSNGGGIQKWNAEVLSRLKAWNMNTIGAWSTLRGEPYVVEFPLSGKYMDVFDLDNRIYEPLGEAASRTNARVTELHRSSATLDTSKFNMGYGNLLFPIGTQTIPMVVRQNPCRSQAAAWPLPTSVRHATADQTPLQPEPLSPRADAKACFPPRP